MEDQEATPIVEQAIEETQAEETPTKTVKNFWERLDEVFNLSKQTNQNLEQILEQFPEVQQINQQYSSALFQPERISLCSNDDIQGNTSAPTLESVITPPTDVQGHYSSEYFSNFRVRLLRPLRNVKSIQLLSATIPNATTNIPDSQTFYWWYKIRNVADSIIGAWNGATSYTPGDIVSYGGNNLVCATPSTNVIPATYWTQVQLPILPTTPTWSSTTAYVIGNIIQYNNVMYQCTNNNTNIRPDLTYWLPTTLPADTTRPNYYDLNVYHLYYVYLAPTYFYPADYVPNEPNYFNRTYQDYQDIVDALNFCMSQAQGNNNAQLDISFQYNATLNKIIMVPSPAQLADGYYFVPCGYEDPNIPLFMASPGTVNFGGNRAYIRTAIPFTPQSILNTRLGFTWNGRIPNVFLFNDPWSSSSILSTLYWYMRKTDPYLTAINGPMITETITANSYCDLVNTSCVRIYADFTFGSTQDSLGSTNTASEPVREGLLSIIPVNTNNLGVGFYQNNFNNPLTKIPKNIAEIGISMLTDQGLPFYLPNSATVLLECAIEYI